MSPEKVEEDEKHSNVIFRYMIIGAGIGAFFGLSHLSFLLQSDQSAYIIHVFSTYILALIASLPWCLITIFTSSDLLSASIVALGAMVNGALIGAAYGIVTGP